MNLISEFAVSVQRHAGKTALYWGKEEYSYGHFWEQTRCVSSRLQKHFGVRRGHRVGLWLKNSPEFVPALFGVLHAGGVAVPINSFLKPDEVIYIINDAGLDVLIADSELGQHFPTLLEGHAGLQLFSIEQPAAFDKDPGDSDILSPAEGGQETIAESDLALLIYTSGTTGRPKGAMLSHGNLLHNIESCRIVLKMVETDRFAVLLPLFHSYMITVGVLLPLIVGGSLVLVKSLNPVRNALQEIFQREVTILPAIPQFYRSMVHAPIEPPIPLRLCISGAAPLPAQVLQEFEAKFHIPLIEGYGLSEASPVVTKNPLDATRKPGSIGLPIPNVEVSIQDDSGRDLPDNEVGEVCVRGGNVMVGYWKQPEETAKVLRNGWLLTGDIGYRDSEGYFFITDRKKDMLLVNGINVYPREIEEILYQFPGVKEAAVIGKPDKRKGEQPIAFISATDGAVLEENAVQLYVRKRLADYKVPRRVIVLPALPRNATGKILKTTLRQMEVSA